MAANIGIANTVGKFSGYMEISAKVGLLLSPKSFSS